MPSLSLEFKGQQELEQNLRALTDMTPDELSIALYKECEIEMNEAKKRTPVDTGALRNSGHVHRLTDERGTYGIRLGFGGPAGAGNMKDAPTNDTDVGYAVYVHENLDAIHPTGEAKFLESVLIESAPYLPTRIAERVKRAWAKRNKT